MGQATDLLERYKAGKRDFRNADLGGANLIGATLNGANLNDANLNGANLNGANLIGATLNGADLIGATLIGTILNGATLNGTILNGATLRGAYLNHAYLIGAYLIGADLDSANLGGAILHSAILHSANLIGADLHGANLGGAILSGANLSGANLSGADLSDAGLPEANLCRVDLSGATICRTVIAMTILVDMNLGPLCSSGTNITAPCIVDWRTVARSLRCPDLQSFLVKLGTPDVFATYMIDCARSIDAKDLFTMLQSTFISYGGPDEEFATKLKNALVANGVKTWFFPKDAIPGEKLHREMWTGVQKHDRVILICSKDSLKRTGVLNEIERVLERESAEGGSDVFIPIRLDDSVFGDWAPKGRPDVADQIQKRVVADFSGWEDEKKFNESLGKLLRALKREADNEDQG